MTQLQTALENTDLPELLMGTVDVIILLTEIYPSTFTKHFRVRKIILQSDLSNPSGVTHASLYVRWPEFS
jgi:hypothetical protein